MRTFQFLMFVVMVAVLSPVTSFANLVDEVDKLSPAEALLVQQKLKTKTMAPLPESFVTKMAFTFSGGKVFASPDAFNAAQGSSFDKLDAVHASLLWRVGSNWYFGVGGSMVQKKEKRETIVTDVFEDLRLTARVFQIQTAMRVNLGGVHFLIPLVGLGVVRADGYSEISNDNTLSSYNLEFDGIGFSAIVGLDWQMELSEIFAFGLGGGYLHAKVTNLKRSGVKSITTPADIDASGAFFGVRFSYNFR